MIECRPRSFERRLIRSRSGRPLFGRSAPFRTAISRAAELPPAANTSEQSYCLLDARPKLLSGLRDSRERAHHRHRVNSAPVAMINRYLDWYPATREFASGASNQKPIRARDASLGRPADCHASYPPPSDGKRHRRSVSLAASLSGPIAIPWRAAARENDTSGDTSNSSAASDHNHSCGNRRHDVVRARTHLRPGIFARARVKPLTLRSLRAL